MSKKRPPIEQLRQAGKIARQMLVDKGVIPKKSILDEIMHLDDAPTLPGIPPYLPHQWTIKAAQRIMLDLLVIWREECKDNGRRAEDILEFFKFLVKELRARESEYSKEVKEMPKLVKAMEKVPYLKDIFSPMRKEENVKAMNLFFIDSFAVAVVLKNNTSTSEFANWFLDWTQDLYAIWVKPDERKDIKRV